MINDLDFEEAKKTFKENYTQAGLEITDDNQRELYLKVQKKSFHISEEEITEYAEFEKIRSSFKALPVECSLCSLSYREQTIGFSEVNRLGYFLNNLKEKPNLKDKPVLFGDRNENIIYAEISKASKTFINFFRFEETYLQKCLERIHRSFTLDKKSSNEAIKLSQKIYEPLTIKIYNIQTGTIEETINKSNQVIDACLFELSYLKDITLFLESEFSRRQSRIKPFQFDDTIDSDNLPFPRKNFNSDIIRFYQRGMKTNDPIIQFLSFYQVLEYYSGIHLNEV